MLVEDRATISVDDVFYKSRVQRMNKVLEKTIKQILIVFELCQFSSLSFDQLFLPTHLEIQWTNGKLNQLKSKNKVIDNSIQDKQKRNLMSKYYCNLTLFIRYQRK